MVNTLEKVYREGRRIVNALGVATQSGIEAYRGGYIGLGSPATHEYQRALQRYQIFEAWYDNVQFDGINAYVAHLRSQVDLYRHIRGIYNPVRRLVNLEVAKVYGGSIDWAGGLRVGAIPIVGADDTLVSAITQILKWSNFGIEKDPLVRTGGKLGVNYIKVVDYAQRGRIRMEILSPYKVREVEHNEVGDVKRIVIQTYHWDADTRKEYVAREVIDDEWFRYWRSYNLTAFDEGRDPGLPENEYRNPYGFVPVRQILHTKEGDTGHPSFYGYLGKITQLNDIAAPVHDAVRLGVNYMLWTDGSRIADPNKDEGTRKRNEVKVINMSKGSSLNALKPELDIMSGLAAMDKLIAELERDMPQLSLQRIRESGGDASGVSIENSYSDASDLLIALQGNYDEGLTRALQMAISMAAYRNLPGFQMYDPVKSYERGDLDFYIKERSVFSDRVPMAERERLIIEASTCPARKLVLRDLGVSEEDIAEMDADAKEADYNQAAGAMAGLAEQAFGKETGETVIVDEESEI